MKKQSYIVLLLIMVMVLTAGCEYIEKKVTPPFTLDDALTTPPIEEVSDRVRVERLIGELLYEAEIVPVSKVFMKTPGIYLLELAYPLSETQSEVVFLEVTKENHYNSSLFVFVSIDKVIIDTTLTTAELHIKGEPSVVKVGTVESGAHVRYNATLYIPSSAAMSSVPMDRGKFGTDSNFEIIDLTTEGTQDGN